MSFSLRGILFPSVFIGAMAISYVFGTSARAETSISVGTAFDRFINGAAELSISTPSSLMDIYVDGELVGTSDSDGKISLLLAAGTHFLRVAGTVSDQANPNYLDIQYFETTLTLVQSQIFELRVGAADISIQSTEKGDARRRERADIDSKRALDVETATLQSNLTGMIGAINTLSDDFADDVASSVVEYFPDLALRSAKPDSSSDICPTTINLVEILRLRGWDNERFSGKVSRLYDAYLANVTRMLEEPSEMLATFNTTPGQFLSPRDIPSIKVYYIDSKNIPDFDSDLNIIRDSAFMEPRVRQAVGAWLDVYVSRSLDPGFVVNGERYYIHGDMIKLFNQPPLLETFSLASEDSIAKASVSCAAKQFLEQMFEQADQFRP